MRLMHTTAQKYCLPGPEFPFATESLIPFDVIIGRRFPNPVPAGTAVPYWAFIDVTVRNK
jgi:hypothetical protein